MDKCNNCGCHLAGEVISLPADQKFASDLLTRKEAAEYLGVSTQTLAIWRCTGRYGLSMVKIGRLAKYRKSDLDEFINRRQSA